MNLLKHYIEKVISIEEFKIDETWAKGIDFVKVKITTNCHGDIRTEERIFTVQEWNSITKVGYYLGQKLVPLYFILDKEIEDKEYNMNDKKLIVGIILMIISVALGFYQMFILKETTLPLYLLTLLLFFMGIDIGGSY